jgi:hypothetical protein
MRAKAEECSEPFATHYAAQDRIFIEQIESVRSDMRELREQGNVSSGDAILKHPHCGMRLQPVRASDDGRPASPRLDYAARAMRSRP